MGLIMRGLNLVFGGGRNLVADTAEVWRENTDRAAARAATAQSAALAQLAAEYERPRRNWFDSLIDGVNRLPRPMLALGVVGLFGMALRDPLWFSARMQGLALVPEPMWWLMGVVVSFYFGARHQVKSQDFQRDLAQAMARVPHVVDNLAEIDMARTAVQPERADLPAHDHDTAPAQIKGDADGAPDNPALIAWHHAAQRPA